MENVYNTTDPQKLLALKRLEAQSLLDVLRTINHAELKINQLCLIARNVLRAQLGVRKMVFYYESEGTWKEGIRLGFESFSELAQQEMLDIHQVTQVSSANHPGLAKLEAEYVIPVVNRNETNAYFIIADFADTEVEAQNDLIFVETMANILSVSIRNKQLFRENMNRELIQKELEVAGTIQKQLLISDFDRFTEFDVHGVNISHHHIGGDFFDVIRKGDDFVFVCIADVAGKGIAAALLMSNVQANLRALCAQYSDISDIITELNNILFKITGGDRFVTLFLAKIDTQQKQLTYVNAGHNYPIFQSLRTQRYLETGCLILGISPDITVQKDTVKFSPGDVLCMYTDGVVEQLNPQEEMFGLDRLQWELQKTYTTTAKEIIDRMLESLRDFSAQSRLNDDITMLTVKFK